MYYLPGKAVTESPSHLPDGDAEEKNKSPFQFIYQYKN